ncbi:MAG: hypothetical protein GTO54_03530, partial [Nitrososphaeria archaeon]|nr:hypothetical protein [Nitrososphaeria archaeon]
MLIEKLEGQLKARGMTLERLQVENASLKEEISDLATEAATRATMKKEIEELRSRITQQN